MKWALHDAFTCLRSPAKPKPTNRSINQVRYNLGVPGKTKEGYDCYVHYDKDCTPVEAGSKAKAAIRAPAKPFCHPYDPSCNKLSSPAIAIAEAPKAVKDGVILPHPDCDPEYDYNCRLRRAERAAAEEGQAADKAVKEAPAPRFEDFLRGIMKQHE